MSFFIPSFGGQGGGGGVAPAPSNAFTAVALQGDTLVFVRDNGGRENIDLTNILPTDTITDIALNGNELVITKTDGTVNRVDLSKFFGVQSFTYDDATKRIEVTNENNQQYTIELGEFVTEVNGQHPIDGVITVNANQIQLEANPAVTIEEELARCIKTLNNQQPDVQGNIDVRLEDDIDNIYFKVAGQTVDTLTYATQQEVDAIKNNIIVF